LYFTIFIFNIPKNDVIIKFYTQKRDPVVNNYLNFVYFIIYCRVSCIKNLLPDDVLKEKRPKHVVT